MQTQEIFQTEKFFKHRKIQYDVYELRVTLVFVYLFAASYLLLIPLLDFSEREIFVWKKNDPSSGFSTGKKYTSYAGFIKQLKKKTPK